MNWCYQRKQIKPTAKCCDWCELFNECYGAENFPKAEYTHRQILKFSKEMSFRYCKKYRFSKANFKDYKKICEENAKLTMDYK